MCDSSEEYVKADKTDAATERPDYTRYNIFFSHIYPLLTLAKDRSLENDDLGIVATDVTVHDCHGKFQSVWTNEMRKLATKRSVWWVIFAFIGPLKILSVILLSSVQIGAGLANPLLMKAINNSKSEIAVRKPSEYWILIALTFVCPILSSFCQTTAQMMLIQMGVRNRNALTSAVYLKTLRYSSSKIQIGLVTNMYANDVRQVESVMAVLSGLIVLPLSLAITLWLIYLEVGVSIFIGLAVAASIFVPMAFAGTMMLVYYRKYMQCGDRRVKLMNEILGGIRVIKYYGWEVSTFTPVNILCLSVKSILFVDDGMILCLYAQY